MSGFQKDSTIVGQLEYLSLPDVVTVNIVISCDGCQLKDEINVDFEGCGTKM